MGSTKKHTHDVLDSLTQHCQGTKQERANKKSSLIHQFHLFNAKPGESLTDICNRFITLINNLKLLGKTYDNYEMNLKLIGVFDLSDSCEWKIISSHISLGDDFKFMPLHKLVDVLIKLDLDVQKEKLIRKYHEFTAKPGESITEMFDRFEKLVNDLGGFGRTRDNYEVNIKFLQALPSSWYKTAVAIRVCNDMDAMTLQKLYEKLYTYEMDERKDLLVRKYHEFTAKPGESITELYDRFNGLVNELRLLGRTCGNHEVNIKFLRALPSSWDKRATPIRLCNDMCAMTLQELYEKLYTYEMDDRKDVLVAKYHEFTAKPGESITELYDRFNGLVDELRLLGRTCGNHEVNIKFLRALPSSWDKWAAPIRICNDMHAMPLEVLYGKLKAYELEDQQKKEWRQYHKNKALVEEGLDSDKSDMCSRGQSKVRSKLYTSNH